MKLFIICTLFIFYSCAPAIDDNSNNINKTLTQPTKITNFQPELLETVIVLLDDNQITTKIFYEEFVSSHLINQINNDIQFFYSAEELIGEKINNTIVIGPTKSSDLILLKEQLGNNNLILSLTNDFTLKKELIGEQIVFLGMSPFYHLISLKEVLDKSSSIGVLYNQNFYGVRLVNFMKEIFDGKYIKSSPYTERPEDINLAIQELGHLIQYDGIVIIDDSLSYKDVLTSLSSQNSIYEYDKTYLIDNFLEQRNSISSFYNQINRTYLINENIENHNMMHREYFYRVSANIAFAIVESVLKNKSLKEIVLSKELGYLELKNNVINYPILFK